MLAGAHYISVLGRRLLSSIGPLPGNQKLLRTNRHSYQSGTYLPMKIKSYKEQLRPGQANIRTNRFVLTDIRTNRHRQYKEDTIYQGHILKMFPKAYPSRRHRCAIDNRNKVYSKFNGHNLFSSLKLAQQSAHLYISLTVNYIENSRFCDVVAHVC